MQNSSDPGGARERSHGLAKLFVEGENTKRFCVELIRLLSLDAVISTENFQGVSQWVGFIRGRVASPDFETIRSIGIIRDADQSASNAFRSIIQGVRLANRILEESDRDRMPIPRVASTFVGRSRRLGVFILPDGTSNGMLETLCVRALSQHPAHACVEQYLDCVDAVSPGLVRNREKTRFQATIAIHRPDQPWPDQALRAGVISLDAPEMQRLILFLRELAGA